MKKSIFLCVFISLCSSHAWAEDINQDTYSQGLALPNVMRGATQPPRLSSASVPNIKVPQLNRQEIASLHLDVLRNHVENIKSSGLFGSLFSTTANLNPTLIQDIDIFFQLYPDLDLAAEALFLQGQIYAKQKDVEQAAVVWLQVLYEFPDAQISTNVRQRLAALLAKGWTKHAKQIQPLLDHQTTGDRPTRLNKLINQLYEIEDKHLANALLALQVSFLKRFPQYRHVDEVQVLMGHNLGSTSAESGIYAFKKLLALYVNSPYRAEALLGIADLQRLRLRKYDQAVQGYKKLIEAYPTHPLSKSAYQSLALTFNKHLKNYGEAISVYNTIIDRYPEEPSALSSLQTIAKLQEKKTGQPRDAVLTLRKIATMFSGSEAVEALESAIKIAKNKLKDQTLMMEIQQQLVRDFPKSKAAPLALFDMAKFTEKERKDQTQARALYQQFIQQYPEHKKAAEARKHL